MKVISKTVNKNETSIELDLFEGRDLKPALKKKIADEVGQFIVEQTLVAMNEQRSPVRGEGSFKPLSPEYKKRKKLEVGNTTPNLEFDGILKDELDYEITESGVAIGVFGERAPAADGHNNLSGKSKLPTRRFLPDEGQEYKANIKKEVERIVADVIAEETAFSKKDFEGIETKAQLYNKLKSIFGDLPRGELQLAVYRNEDLTVIFKKLNLTDLL